METVNSTPVSEPTSNNTEQTTNSTPTSVPVPETTPAVIEKQPTKPVPKTIRIHVNITDQPRPVVFNYRQLYKRELKKFETATEPTIEASRMEMSLDSADDLFYKELLKKAESYAMDEDDVDDDGSDEEVNNAAGNKKQVGNDYDFEDPFIDDSEMMLDEPQEYSAPEFDGFFVYHGPLDGHEATAAAAAEKNKPATTKRKPATKAKSSTSASSTAATTTAATTGTAAAAASSSSSSNTSKRSGGGNASGEKSRKKPAAAAAVAGDDGERTAAAVSATSKAKKPATSTSTASATSKSSAPSKPSLATSSSSTSSASNSIVSRKSTTTSDQPAKKRKKLDTAKESDHAKSTTASPALSASHEEPEKKKKSSTPAELKPLDPEIEKLMVKLRKDVVHEDFENKAKFPLALKPTVLEAGLIMLRKNKEIDENLVYHLMSILPYNRFTLKKFLTTKSGQMRVDELQQEIDELAILLKQTIDKMMPEQQRLFDEKLAQAAAEPSNTEEEAPQPKFKCNDEVRKILYDIIQSEEQSIHIANQVAIHKDSEKKNEGLASDGKARKLMYQRLLSCWPEGWMNSYEMSRQYSQYKLKASSSEKKAAAAASSSSALPSNNSTSDAKKRKRVTPQSSPSDEGLRKKQSVMDSGVIPPDFQQKIKANLAQSAAATQQQQQKPPVITIDDDDEETATESIDNMIEQINNRIWKPNSMKIEALISGPSSSSSHEKKD